MDDKIELRTRQRTLRDAVDPAERAVRSQQLAVRGVAALRERAAGHGAVVSAYWPMRSEADPRPLAKALAAFGAALALPCFVGKTMLFRAWPRDDELVPAGFQTFEPPPGAAVVVPTLVLAPLLAFDRAGNRLGWGKGYYDTALGKLDAAAKAGQGVRPFVVGFAFACQEVAAVPAEAHDRRLDAIVTEDGFPAMLTVVWAYRRTGKFAFHVLTGALETDERTARVPIEFANGVDAVVGAITAALAVPHARVLVGWSFYSPDAAAMTAELRTVKVRIDDARVLHVCGGVHATAEPEATLRAGWDLVAIGEGERLVRDLLVCVANGGEPRDVPGIASLAPDGVLRRNGRAERIALDDFPPFGPAHDRFGPIEITRGCVYACRFCQTPYFAGASFRHRSVDNVRHWARYLVGRGFRDFRFLTPTSLSYGAHGPEPDLAAVEALLAGVREEIGTSRKLWFGTFPSEVRPEHVSAASLRLLRKWVSNRTLIVGGQSGSDRVLAASARGHDAACIERAVSLCVEHGFVPHVDFLLGLPGEQTADVDATLAMMDRLVGCGAKVHGHTFLPLPGTPFRKAAPGALTDDVRRRLRNLASKGQLYGQWEQQEATAKEMAAGRAARG